MERNPISLNIKFFKEKERNLYYKKIILSKNTIRNKSKTNNSFSVNKNESRQTKNNILKISLQKKVKNSKKIKEIPIIRQNNSYLTLNKTLKHNNSLYTKIKVPYINMKHIIFIQKIIRGFIVRKTLKNLKQQKNKQYLIKTAHPKRFKNMININILDEIKKNSKRQKESIKKTNNIYNNNCNTLNPRKDKINAYKKNIIYLNKGKGINKKYSFDSHKKRQIKNKTDLILDDNYNKELKPLKSIKKTDCPICVQDTDFSISNFLTEQSPQKLNSNFENDTNENNKNLINNRNIKEELLDKKKLCQTDGNIIKNNNNIDNINSNIFFNKNNKNLVIPSRISSYQTKENTSFERNNTMENNNNYFNLDISHNKNGQKTVRDINNINKKNKFLEIQIKDKTKENNISIDNIDNFVKDEFNSGADYENNKKNIKMINSNIKFNFNHLINSKIKLKNINNNKNDSNNKINIYNEKYTNRNLDIYNNDKKTSESIKEEKFFYIDNDLKSLKSSFYDENEFIIINYDYSLNDKKKLNNTLKISNAENINITGHNKKNKFINTIKKIIYRNVNIYVFSILKKFKKNNEDNKDEEDEKSLSLTDNESSNYIPQVRINKHKIIFNYAQKEMENNNSHLIKK